MTRQDVERPRARSGLVGALRETAVVVVSALVLSLLIKTFLVQAFFIPSQSMETTLLVGDRVLVSKLTPGPFSLQRGDVVVFSDPGGWLDAADTPDRGPVAQAVVGALTFVGVLPDPSDQHLVKRVIGLPGDHVVGSTDGPTTVNGAPIDESPYLRAGSTPSEIAFDVVVPPDQLWVEGDNRQDSRDSRWHLELASGGFVPEDLVVGRAVVRAWPLDRLGWLSDHREVFEYVPAASS